MLTPLHNWGSLAKNNLAIIQVFLWPSLNFYSCIYPHLTHLLSPFLGVLSIGWCCASSFFFLKFGFGAWNRHLWCPHHILLTHLISATTKVDSFLQIQPAPHADRVPPQAWATHVPCFSSIMSLGPAISDSPLVNKTCTKVERTVQWTPTYPSLTSAVINMSPILFLLYPSHFPPFTLLSHSRANPRHHFTCEHFGM